MTTVEKITIRGRLSYHSLAEMSQFGDGKPNYNATLIIDPTDARGKKDLQDLAVLMKNTAEQKGWNWEKNIKKNSTVVAVIESEDGEEEPIFAGQYRVKTKTTKEFVKKNQKNEPVNASLFYAGCYVNLVVSAFGWDFNGKKGVSLNLLGVQFVSDGEPLSSTFADDSDFEVLEDEEAPAPKAKADSSDAPPPPAAKKQVKSVEEDELPF